MGELVRRFATRVILLHLLGLAAMVLLVLGAAGQVYRDTRAQAIAQMGARQELVAGQTARGIAEFFDSILDNLDLLRRAEGSEQLAPRERPEGSQGRQVWRQIEIRRQGMGGGVGGGGGSGGGDGPREPVRRAPPSSQPIGRVQWGDGVPSDGGVPWDGVGWGQGAGWQGLFVAQLRSPDRPAERVAERPYEGPFGPATRRLPGEGGGRGGIGERPAAGGTGPAAGAALPSASAATGQLLWRQLEGRASHLFAVDPRSGQVFEVGRRENAAPTPEVAATVMTELRATTRPGVTRVHHVGGAPGGGPQAGGAAADASAGDGAFIVACAPVLTPDRQPRVLAAVVPVAEIRQRFLGDLSEERSLTFTLFDAGGSVLASNEKSPPPGPPPTTAGTGNKVPASVTGAGTALPGGVRPSGAGHGAAGPVTRPTAVVFADGLPEQGLPPAIVIDAPVDIEGPDWRLVVVSPLTDVDTLLAGVFRRTVFWSTFLVLGTAGLLVSTATQLIRDRMRLEREQQRAMRRELEQARRIQLEWLPARFPETPGLRAHAVNLPASSVSGDFYNFIELPGGRWALVVGDVTGHGMSAAMQMSSVQLLLMSALRTTSDPGAALTQVNDTLCLHDFNGQFVTLLVAVVDIAARTLEVATAGHPAPVLLSAGAAPVEIPLEPELMLGVDATATYVTQHRTLPPGPCTLVLYTDGLPEAMDARNAQFGTPRVLDTLARVPPTAGPEAVNRSLTDAVDVFRAGKPLGDDLTLVAAWIGSRTAD